MGCLSASVSNAHKRGQAFFGNYLTHSVQRCQLVASRGRNSYTGLIAAGEFGFSFIMCLMCGTARQKELLFTCPIKCHTYLSVHICFTTKTVGWMENPARIMTVYRNSDTCKSQFPAPTGNLYCVCRVTNWQSLAIILFSRGRQP